MRFFKYGNANSQMLVKPVPKGNYEFIIIYFGQIF